MIKKDSLLKIGYLNVEIINHTQKLYNDSIQKFDINIRSDWNDEIKNVYAFIDINGSTAKTTPANLQNFEEKILTAYIDTTSIPVGNHTVNISLFYEDKTTSESSLIEIIERPLIKEKLDINWTIVLLVVIIILLVITTIFFMFTFMKNNKPKKEKIHKNNKDSK